jgi:nickel/cobalt exporter
MRAGARSLAAWCAALALLLGAPAAVAHPLGNFSISQYGALELAADGLYLRYLVDMAEIPTFQAIQDAEVVAEVDHPAAVRYATRMAETLAQGAHVSVGGRRASLEVLERDVIFPPGAGGLPTLKLGVLYRIRADVVAAGESITLEYRDENFAERAGWKEVIAVARAGVTVLQRDVPDVDRSQELSAYPTDLLDSPPQVRSARVTFVRDTSAAGGVLTGATPPRPLALRAGGRAPTSRVADLIGARELGIGIVLTALVVAAALGAFHALEPGHGKSIVAAYLVGSRGTARHAVILGLVVTASHTAGVYLLGGVTFYASAYVVPERLYPWLAVTSGLMIAVVGGTLFLRRWGRPLHGHDHSHGHGHHHAHGEHEHSHDHADGPDHDHAHGHAHPHGHEVAVRLRDLVALGISGGIVPCPAALVVLLTAVSAHKIGFGLLLIVAFSLGLAAVLVAIGVLMVYARRAMARYREDGPLLTRWLPLTSSAVMTVLGVAIAVQALPWTAR